MKKDTYLVEGMTCSGCERAIQKVVGNLEGVSSSKANLQSSSITVEYDPSVVSIDKISSAIKSIGYKFVGQLPSQGQKESSDEAVA